MSGVQVLSRVGSFHVVMFWLCDFNTDQFSVANAAITAYT